MDICPGSGIYLIETDDDVFECVGCSMALRGVDALRAHVREHHEKGHHVDRRLFDPETIAEQDAKWESMSEDDRYMATMRLWDEQAAYAEHMSRVFGDWLTKTYKK